MTDRNVVAYEKMERAIEMLKERQIDMWLFYSRMNRDTSLELMFHTSTLNEVLFLLTRNGRKIAVAQKEDAEAYKNSGLYTEVITVGELSLQEAVQSLLKEECPQTLALNVSQEDNRCDGLTLGLYKKLERIIGEECLNKIKVSSFPMLEELRAVKTVGEIEIMKECSRITTDIYDALFSRVRAGMSEVDVAEIMMEECAKRDVITAFGNPPEYPLVLNPKGGMSHRKPNPDNICEPGDMLVIDFSIRYLGYTSDIARTMYFLKEGETHAPREVTECVNAAIGAVEKILEKIRPGMKGWEVDAIGRSAITECGYPEFGHATGHQVGLEPHDGGTLLGMASKRASNGILRENEIYALEPTVLQAPDKPSAIVEDNILLTKEGYVLISKRQTELVEIPYCHF